MTEFLIGAEIVLVLGAFAGGVYVQWRFGFIDGKLMALKEQAKKDIGKLEGEARIKALALKDRADKERVALVKRVAEAAGVNIQVL